MTEPTNDQVTLANAEAAIERLILRAIAGCPYPRAYVLDAVRDAIAVAGGRISDRLRDALFEKTWDRLLASGCIVPVAAERFALFDETFQLPDGARQHGELVARNHPFPAFADGGGTEDDGLVTSPDRRAVVILSYRSPAMDPVDAVHHQPYSEIWHRVFRDDEAVGPAYGSYQAALLLAIALSAGQPGDDPVLVANHAWRLIAPARGASWA